MSWSTSQLPRMRGEAAMPLVAEGYRPLGLRLAQLRWRV